MIAEVIIDSRAKKLNRKFDYKIPEKLEDIITIGSRVLVPFANFKTLEQGYVIKIKQNTEFEVKEIAGLEENLSEEKIKLARWMARKYFCNVSECIKLMLTPGTKSKDIEKRLQDKKINFVYMGVSENDIDINSLKGEKQKKAIEFIMKNQGLTIPEIMNFSGVSRETINSLVKKGYIEIKQEKVDRNPLSLKKSNENKKLKLTEEQELALEKVENSIEEKKFEEFLLYGVTGSGKTEVYMQLIEKVIKNGKSAILLVPEISLTPQMLDRFIGRFGKDKIAVLHSKLSIGERHDEWIRIKEEKSKIVIGARSAIFAPVKNLGIIIIDEEHDSSYKSESSPRYNAKEIAEKICKENNIPLILGSATPDINTFYRTNLENKDDRRITLLKLTKRANNSSLPKVKIVDLKKELAIGNKTMFSTLLHKLIEENLKNKHQTILFLNRRGYSTFIMCRECGYTMKCPNCNISLTYHSFQNKLKCHYCGHEENPVKICPNCGSTKIRYFGTGTQKIEEEVKKEFPEASTIRMDVDTVSKKNSHEEILNKFKKENIDILIGTQMVVKGHHFPNVTLVGVITADTNLNLGDFRANEKTFQTLTQVAGRAGREKERGRVIIQTYNPENYSIEFAKTQNYDLFYNTEIKIRKQLKYPPFCDIIVVSMSAKDIRELNMVAKKLHTYLKDRVINEKFGVLLYSPVPNPIDKIKDRYRKRIIIKCKYDERINALMADTLNLFYSMKTKTARTSVELNPNNML